MTTKKPINVKADLNYDFLEVGGATTYTELETQFKQYCQEYTLKNRPTESTKPTSTSKTINTPHGLRVHAAKTSEISPSSFFVRNGISELLSFQTQDSQNFKTTEADDTTVTRLHQLVRRPSYSGQNTYDDEVNQLIQEFGISTSVLATMQNPDDKHKYVVECMNKRVNDDLKEFNKKHNVRLHHILNFEDEFQKNKLKLEKDSSDIFEWMNINTKHVPLKKKLRSRLAETIHDHENQTIIEASMDEIQRSRDSLNTSSTKKIQLSNVPIVDNYEILQDLLSGQSDNLLKMTKSMKHAQRKNHEQSFKSVSPVLSPHRETLKEDIIHELEADVQPSKKQYWSPDKEHAFRVYREDAKSRLFDKINSSNWNGLGFSPIVQASTKEEKSRLQRDKKLAKYMNGDLLTPEEYKLLANTSITLNKFVDKKYLQTVINNVDPDVVQALEIDLAEESMKNFQTRNKEIRESRLNYLKDKNTAYRQYIEMNDQANKKHFRILEGKEQQKKIKKRAVSMLEKIDERKKWRKDSARPDSTPLVEDNFVDIDRFAKKFLKVIDKKQAEKKHQNNLEFLKRLLPYSPAKDPDEVKVIQHYHHPPSKVLVKPDPENTTKDFLGLGTDNLNPSLAKRKNDAPEKYKLSIHSDPKFKVKSKFKEYYSGGPLNDDDRVFQGGFVIGDVSTYKLDKFEERNIKKIQAAYRGYRQRKAFRKMREKIQDKNRTARRKEYIKKAPGGPGILKALFMMEDKEREKNKPRKSTYVITNPSERRQSNPVLASFSPYYVEKTRGVHLMSSLLSTSPKASDMPASLKGAGNMRSFDNIDMSMKYANTSSPGIEEPMETHKSHKSMISGRPMTATPKASSMLMTTSGRTKVMVNNHLVRPKHPLSVVTSDNENSIEEERMAKIVQRSAPKGLLLKQRRLFKAAKANTFAIIKSSGFNYYESDVNIKDERGNTPLYYAAKKGSKEICDFLVRHKAHVNEPCAGGNTPLHVAFASGEIMIVILLISYGGNLNVLNDKRQTPIAFGSESLLALLGLKEAIATYNGGGSTMSLPQEHDNNRFMKNFQAKMGQNKDYLSFDYGPLQKSLGKVDSESKVLRGSGVAKVI